MRGARTYSNPFPSPSSPPWLENDIGEVWPGNYISESSEVSILRHTFIFSSNLAHISHLLFDFLYGVFSKKSTKRKDMTNHQAYNTNPVLTFFPSIPLTADSHHHSSGFPLSVSPFPWPFPALDLTYLPPYGPNPCAIRNSCVAL